MFDIPALLANKSEAHLKAALDQLLAAHTMPVFGETKQVEHEVTVLRTLTSPQQINDVLRALVGQSTATKGGDLIVLEAPQPFLMGSLHHRVRQLVFLSDGSFACSIARLPQRALAALIEDLIRPADHKSVAERLRRQDIEGDDLQSLVLGLIKTAGRAAAGSAGEQLGAPLAEGVGVAFKHLNEAIAQIRTRRP